MSGTIPEDITPEAIQKAQALPYIQTYANIWVACLDRQQHEETCGYWYTVSSHATSHVAFVTTLGLTQWLDERGLKLTDSLPEERGTHKAIRVEGSYSRAMYMNAEAWKAIEPLFTVSELSNAEYTLGKITEENGVRTVHFLNPNVRERTVFPYRHL
jgi:hypothetical protein